MRLRTLVTFAAWLTCAALFAQYPYSLDPVKPDSLAADTALTDTLASAPAPAAKVKDPAQLLKSEALTWVRRIIYRGFLDDDVTAVTAIYALTDWKEITGPSGPVLAHVQITYHGAVSWVGKDAAWIQATYKSFDGERPTVDFDLIVERGEPLGQVYRALWRQNKEEFTAVNFDPPAGDFDYERQDQPKAAEETELKLFAGTFPVTVYRGSGADGAKVIAYRSADLPPFDLVRLGYGTRCLNYRDRIVDAEPKFQVPLPTTR